MDLFGRHFSTSLEFMSHASFCSESSTRHATYSIKHYAQILYTCLMKPFDLSFAQKLFTKHAYEIA